MEVAVHNESNSIWAKIIKSLYGPNGGFETDSPHRLSSNRGTWKFVIDAGKRLDSIGLPFNTSFVKTAGNGATTSFWNEVWIGDECLRNKFKWMYQLEEKNDATVQDRIVKIGDICSGSWCWTRSPLGRALGELENLSNMINSFVFRNIDGDSWSWNMTSSGRFTTKALTDLIEEKIFAGNTLHIETQCNNLIPKKIEVFTWRARLRRLAVRVMDLDSILCPLCNNDIESVEHSLILCQNAMEVWKKVYNWWGFTNVSNLSISEAFLGRSSHRLSPLQEKAWQAVECVSGYLIWKNRNQKIFNNKTWNSPMALNEVQVKSFEWISRRIKGRSIDWLMWLSNPISCVA
ncbi:uncharacterized protein [Rutidosis leptorrhynchoides]|uniref:uncharacterized protein n=1 Tax=Rutidosis leptorrhynchoides TaxID=125765 RepID=UPI003A9983EB